jgi:hypothetical protein
LLGCLVVIDTHIIPAKGAFRLLYGPLYGELFGGFRFRERVPVTAVSWGTFKPGLEAEHISEHQFDKKEILDTYDDPPPTTGE